MTQPPIVVVARLTLKEAIRRKIVIGALLLGAVFLVVFGLGLYFVQQDMVRTGFYGNVMVRNQMYNFMTLSGLYVVNILYSAITVLVAVDTLSGEIASGTIHTLAAKPVRRWEILLGKWAGFALMLTLYLGLMGGGVMALAGGILGLRLHNAARGLALMWLNGMVLLAVTLLGGTLLSTLANGVVAFALFAVAVIGGWIEQIGSFVESQAAVNVGIVSSLLIPTEALWRRAAYEMRSVVVDMIGFSPFTSSSSVPSAAMIAYAVAYALIVLALAVWRFERRDL
jgi:Cu-processing system permease protein